MRVAKSGAALSLPCRRAELVECLCAAGRAEPTGSVATHVVPQRLSQLCQKPCAAAHILPQSVRLCSWSGTRSWRPQAGRAAVAGAHACCSAQHARSSKFVDDFIQTISREVVQSWRSLLLAAVDRLPRTTTNGKQGDSAAGYPDKRGHR